MISNLQQYIAYFATLASSHTGLASYISGHNDDLLSQLRELDYPLLLVEIPDITYTGDEDNRQKNYDVLLEVLQHTELDDYEGRKTAWQTLEKITEDIGHKLTEDFRLRWADLQLTPVMAKSHDNLYGWQLRFQLPVTTTFCKDEAVWQ